MNDQLHAPAVRFRGNSPHPRDVLSRNLGGPQSRFAQLDAEKTRCAYRESNHDSSVVHSVSKSLYLLS